MNLTAELPYEPPFKRRRVDLTDFTSRECPGVESYSYCDASSTLPTPSPSASAFDTPSSSAYQCEETEIYKRCGNIVQPDLHVGSESLQRTCPNEDVQTFEYEATHMGKGGGAKDNTVGATVIGQPVYSRSCPAEYVSYEAENHRNRVHFRKLPSHHEPVLTVDYIVKPKSSALA
jgi:hypothetical protein